MREIGAVPSYYLRYFWAHDAVVEEERRSPTRAEEVAKIERELLGLYADPALDRKPDLLSERGGAFYSEAAVALLASLVADTGDTQVVNVRNAGTFGVPARRGGDRGARGDRRQGPAPGAGRAAVTADARAGGARVGVRGTGRGRRAARRPGPGPDGAAGPSPGRPAGPGRLPDRPAARGEPRLPALGAAGDRRAARPCSPSTAGTARPTWRWWPRTARCWPARAGPGCARSRHPAVLGAIGTAISLAASDAGLAGRFPVADHAVGLHGQRRPARGRGTAGRAAHRAGLERDHRGGQRHVRGAAGRPGRARPSRPGGWR